MLKLVAYSKKNSEDIALEKDDQKNRKKSQNMILALQAVEDIFKQMKDVQGFSDSLIDFIFCSGEGELEQTFEFYKYLAQGLSRPILFQNSLHNSTLGSLSLEIANISSGITLSNGDISFESAIDVALSFQSENPILILGVDFYNEEMKNLRSESFNNQIEFTSGACAGLFFPKSNHLFSSSKGPVIRDIKFESTSESSSYSNYFPSNGLEEIQKQLKMSTASFSIYRPKGHKVTLFCNEY